MVTTNVSNPSTSRLRRTLITLTVASATVVALFAAVLPARAATTEQSTDITVVTTAEVTDVAVTTTTATTVTTQVEVTTTMTADTTPVTSASVEVAIPETTIAAPTTTAAPATTTSVVGITSIDGAAITSLADNAIMEPVLPVTGAAPAATVAVIDGAAVGLSPAVRLNTPAAAADADLAVTPVAPVAPVNVSNCRNNMPGSTMTVTMPDINYHCPVYAGGQSTIDAGAVTLINNMGTGSPWAFEPGAPGTMWLAGHRSSHGASFAAVPNLADGALITVTNNGVTATYQVVGRAYVQVNGAGKVLDSSGKPSNTATVQALLRADNGGNGAPRLLLQTCDGENFRWMIYADLVG